KYGHFIYTHNGTETLYVNLFTNSSLASSDFVIDQTTSFPFSNESSLNVGKAGTYTIAIRHPWWTTGDYKIYINDEEQSISVTAGTASYVALNRTWSDGDVIRVVVPMALRYTPCPNYTDYIAFQYGPILLAAQTSTSDAEEAAEKNIPYEASLQNEYGHEGRMDHAPGSRATSKSLTTMPLLLGERSEVLSKISATDLSNLQFSIDASREGVDGYDWTTLTLQPFYQIHHARYSCYWYQQTAENYANSSIAIVEQANAAIAERTLDFVATGEQQSEAGHYTVSQNSTTGVYNDEHYRDARPSDGYLQYTLSYEGEAIESGLSILCRFTQADAGRKGTLYVDGVAIANITALATFNGVVTNGFYNVEFPIPASLMRDGNGQTKTSFTVRLAADKGTNAPGLYYVRLMKEYDDGLEASVTTSAGDVRTIVDGVITGDNGQSDMSHGMDFDANVVNQNYGTWNSRSWRNARGGQYYGYDLWTNGQTDGVSLVVEYYSGDGGRLADITIDGVTLATQGIDNFFSNFVTVEYPIDPVLLQDKDRIHVQFTSVDNSYTPGTYRVYLTTGRPATARSKTPYTFVPSNFEKNGNDGNISSMTYNDGAIQITSDGGDYAINMRMKTSVKDTYSILPNQCLLLIKGTDLATNAYMWWLMGCNYGKQDAPTYTATDGSDVYLIWDLRKIGNFDEAEKKARFFGVSEVPVTTANGGAYSLACFGLTSSNSGNATITDIGFYSPEELVDKYSVLKSTIKSTATSLTTGSQFVYGDYLYSITDASNAKIEKVLSTGTDYRLAPATVFGYNVSKVLVLRETQAYDEVACTADVQLTKYIYAGWNTLILPFSMTAEEVTTVLGPGSLYSFTDADAGVLNFTSASAIAAHTPYLFKADAAKSISALTIEGRNITVSDNDLKTAGTDYNFVGSYTPYATNASANPIVAGVDYVLGDDNAFHKTTVKNALKAFRCYIQANAGAPAGVKVLSINVDGENTAISNIDGDAVTSAPVFNLLGQRVNKPQKGLYIIQGRKVLVK
ncbi:MAG: glycoside hydrolase family 127 protein, partial [Bacteroidaceae bacterium]|nr:glycoside hydrolase family 127 protein [Bacteroidaceae bacterium]